MGKRICCIMFWALTCASMFAESISSEGTYQGKQWQIWYYGSNNDRLVVDGRTLLSGYYNIESYKIGDKLYFIAQKSEEGIRNLYNINGDLAIPHGFHLIGPFKDDHGESREGIYEVATKKGEKWELELYDADLQLVVPRYRYFWPVKDDEGNIKYWRFESDRGYVGLLSNDWKTWIVPVSKQFTFIFEASISGVKYYNCKKGGYWGLYDTKLNEVIAPEYEELSVFDGTNFIKFKLNGFCGVMTLQGRVTKTIIPTTRGYTDISRYVKGQKRFTYEMNGYKGECNSLGVQVSKIKVATSTPATQTTQQSVAKKGETPQKKQEEQRIIIEHQRQPVPVQEWVQCSVCYGSGTCQTCLGSGTNYHGSRCISCHYSGKCHFCNGQGGRNQTVYR